MKFLIFFHAAVFVCAVPPLVLIPGLTNSVIQYQLVDAEPFKNCNTSTQGKWLPLYPPPNMTLAEAACWVEDFTVSFNASTNMFQNKRRGVITRTIDFGGILGLPALRLFLPYWEKMGWTLGKNLFGAPYDWRFPSSGRPDTFYSDLQKLLENSYNINGQPAVILAPSFGPQFGLGFLHRMSQEWKDKYVSWFIPISPVFGGSVMAAEYFVSGLPAIPHYVSRLVRTEIHAIAVAPWMFPRAGTNSTVSWTKDEPILTTPAKKYSAFDMVEAFTDLGFSDIAMLNFVQQDPDLSQFAQPGVNTYVIYGYDVPTPGPATYNESFAPGKFPVNPTNETISGDDIVPLRSSIRGLVWQDDMDKAGKKLWHRGWKGQVHAGCLFPPGSDPDYPDDGCYEELYAFLVNGTVPPSVHNTPPKSP